MRGQREIGRRAEHPARPAGDRMADPVTAGDGRKHLWRYARVREYVEILLTRHLPSPALFHIDFCERSTAI